MVKISVWSYKRMVKIAQDCTGCTTDMPKDYISGIKSNKVLIINTYIIMCKNSWQ
jgi:hypothetical protein